MANKRLDVNVATFDDFAKLTGVGRSKAEAILETRKALGGFRTVGDITKTPGIGPGVLEQNCRRLFCSLPSAKRTPRKSTRKSRRGLRMDNANDATSQTEDGEMETADPQPSTSSGHNDSSDSTPRIKLIKLDNTEDFDKIENSCVHCQQLRNTTRSGRMRRSCALNIKLELQTPSSSSDGDVVFDEDTCDCQCRCHSNNKKGTDFDRKLQFDTPRTCESSEIITPSSDSSSANIHEPPTAFESMKMDESSDDVDENGSDASGPNSDADEQMEDDDTEGESEYYDDELGDLVSRSQSKSVMKRKCDGLSDLRGVSPGKKPCRLLEISKSLSVPSSQTFSTIRDGCRLARQRIPSCNEPPPQLADWLKTFQEWGHAERLVALDQLIECCEPTQVRHVMAVIEPQFQRDFISLLPKELALYVLSFLEPKDLLRAAQTCRYWRILAEDNLLWREKCREEGVDEALVFGNKARRRPSGSTPSPWKYLFMRQYQIEQNWRTGEKRPTKVLKGHDDHVITCLEFCGPRVVSGSDDNTLKVWSVVTGKCLRTLVGHTGGVWSSQMADNMVISGSTDRTLKVWNADTGQCLHTLYGHTSTVRCMHLSGGVVVSGSRDATLRMWDIKTGQCQHVLMGHVAAVRCVQYDGKRVVSGAYDYMVKVWDPDTETCIHTLQGHTNRVYSLQFDGVHIVSGSLDTSIRVWDVEQGNCLHTLVGHQSLTSGMELKDNILVSGNADSTVKVWDITTGQCLQTLQGANKHQSAVTCLQFNKKFVITSSDDGTVKIWDLKTGDFLRNLVTLESGGSGGVVWRVRCCNTKLVCAVGSRNGTEETKLLVLDFDMEEAKKN
ncbi:F-box/WD repeat-containing protein 7-like isoform X2 [Lineus longissimus]|uniref:F-box/WD repeat-containing protein 7-like isoform X2 n=1 Tax=Lineus longissimus TaxID=88925 RepID=UPI002B4CEC38